MSKIKFDTVPSAILSRPQQYCGRALDSITGKIILVGPIRRTKKAAIWAVKKELLKREQQQLITLQK